jgi:uncharacterized protein (DUF1800 family)
MRAPQAKRFTNRRNAAESAQGQRRLDAPLNGVPGHAVYPPVAHSTPRTHMRAHILVSSALLMGAWAKQVPEPPAAHRAALVVANEPGELLPDQRIQQVLNRLGFGPRPGDAARIRATGVDKWIDQQLHPERIDDRQTDRLIASYTALSLKVDDVMRNSEVVRRLQQQASRMDGDSADRRDVRRELAANPEFANAIRDQRRLVGELQSAKLARAVTSERQLQEVMVDFWENHFSVFAGKGQTRLFLSDYDRNAIRPNAFGKFRDLLGAVAHSPAMLFYLDNWQSAADSLHPTLAGMRNRRGGLARRPRGRGIPGGRGIPVGGLPPGIGQLPPQARRRLEGAAPEERQRMVEQLQNRPKRGLNENYARELMELHTLGVDGGYTQQDVINVARALTGWTFNRQTGAFVFSPIVHDAGEKVVLGHTLPGGRGIEDGNDVLDIVARAPATAHFITLKLARHFVSDDPPKGLVDRCAGIFQKTDGDIRETVGCIVTSPEFFSRAAYRSKVKTPFEVVASGLRAMGAAADTTPRTAQLVARLGQPIFGRQTPDGWPDRGGAWMNTGAILGRINFGLSLAAGQIPGARVGQWPEAMRLRSLPREQQVDGVVATILGGEASPETRQVLMRGDNPLLTQAIATGDTTIVDMSRDPMMDGAGGRAAARQSAPANGGKGFPNGRGAQIPGFGRPVNLQGLPQVIGLALGSPEFQRR